MIYEKELVGKFVTLRSITPEDAEFSYDIRRDPRYAEVMGQSAESVERQLAYINMQREKEGDYYFVTTNRYTNNRIGLIGVYDIVGDSAETGREICVGDAFCAMEARCLLQDFIRDVLKLKELRFVVYKHNERVVNLCYNLGFKVKDEVVRSGVPSYYYVITVEDNEKALEKSRQLILTRAARLGI